MGACATSNAAPAPRRAQSVPLTAASRSSEASSKADVAPEPSVETNDTLPSPEDEPLREFTGEERQRIARVQRYVRAAAEEHGIKPSLVNAIIWVESKFEPRARGHRGPRGLMQLMPRTARGLARSLQLRYQPNSPAFNIDVGTYYFARMLEIHDGDVELALASYNMGPGAVRRVREQNEPLPEQINRYVRAVLRASAAFEQRQLQGM
jgi:soluble lytic murein transglycosylase-like protein